MKSRQPDATLLSAQADDAALHAASLLWQRSIWHRAAAAELILLTCSLYIVLI